MFSSKLYEQVTTLISFFDKKINMKINLLSLKVASIVAIALVTLTANYGDAQPTAVNQITGSHWVGTWAASVQAIDKSTMPPSPPGMSNTTSRQIVHVSIGGKRLRVRLSNEFAGWGDNLKINAAHIALSAGGAAIKPETDKILTFDGKTSVTIPYRSPMVSDPIDFNLPAGSDLAVTIYVKGSNKDISGHRSARGQFAFLQAGDNVSAINLPEAVSTNVWYYLSGVEVLAPETSAAVVCLGDSITDGKGSTEGKNRRWPDFLANRLRTYPETAQIGVLNEGIGGNAVWRGGIGQTALARLDRDVLAQPGVRWVIVLEGINDLGGGKTSADEVIASYKQIIIRCHDRGVKVYGGTIMPCGGSFYSKPGLEEKRQKINAWIRTSGAFDAVIDFDAAVRDPQDPTRMLKSASSGDHLHPNDEGHRLLAQAVDLKLFEQ
jgi:lysophospholipase L1-like esterase